MSDNDSSVPDEGQDDVLQCSFCGKDQFQLRKLVAGPNAHICSDCVEVCADIISDDRSAQARDAPRGSVVGLVDTARCSLCKTPAAATDLITVPTRGAVCETCLTVVAAALRERDRGRPKE